MRIQYCCRFPNQSLFMDSQGDRQTAVVYCNSCQRIAAEIWCDNGLSVLGEEE